MDRERLSTPTWICQAPGAIGEYNGNVTVNQKVLPGASEVTSPGHSRDTYRNFFKLIYAGSLRDPPGQVNNTYEYGSNYI